MKKLCLALFILAMLCSLCACGGSESPETTDEPSPATSSDPTTPGESDTSEPVIETSLIPIHIGESIDNQNFLMTFDSIELLDEYSYSTGEFSSTSLYVEDGYKLLAVKGHFENRATAAISNSSFVCSAVVNGTYEVDNYDVRLDFERSKSFEIDAYTDLDYILYINIPQKLADTFETATFTIGFNNDLSVPSATWHDVGTQTIKTDNLYELTNEPSTGSESAESDQPEENSKSEEIAIGDTITTDEYEFTLENVDLTYELLPSDTSSVYASYPADQGKVYVHVAAKLKNLMKRDIRIDETFRVKALYSDNYTYDGFVIVDTGNNFDWVGSYSAAAPLETAKIHGLVECPVEVDSTDEKLVVVIKMSNNTEYQYTIR